MDYFLIVGVGLLAGVCWPAADVAVGGQPQAVSASQLPPWRLALGGLIVGLLSLLTPKVWGNGYSVVQAFCSHLPLLSVIAGVFICKLLAVLANSGSGNAGSVFTPTLFVGMATGMLFLRRSLRCGFLALRRRSCSGWRV